MVLKYNKGEAIHVTTLSQYYILSASISSPWRNIGNSYDLEITNFKLYLHS